ncbi:MULTISPECIES: hypothetical protein [Sorangium]|uniref:Uncharacterized protein n=1 Tax=Sorangium cellulosum TaxID=56 RepID=A0A4P2R4J2_SORCE|nr:MULTISPECIES: hypothetical protein [Sorangium]AUX38014.1 uncharacterized protein SOCE836_102520 [Sorangium cellulosum]WCQ97302.1 hypothetical protein NQZ70_10093 [Sorangium sp. Soce836]
MPTPTRIDTAELELATAKARKKIDEAFALLAPYLVVLNEAERAAIPRAREGFEQATRSLCRAMAEHTAVATAAGFSSEAVLEDLNNLDVIRPLFERVEELWQRLADSRLAWSAEAWSPSLVAYGVSKAASEVNPALRTVTAPLAKIFATRRARGGEEPQPAQSPEPPPGA